jgi:hypothetical protein
MSTGPGLGIGDSGDAVSALHDELASVGREVDPAERRHAYFGSSTAETVAKLQSDSGLPETGRVDPETASALAALTKVSHAVTTTGTSSVPGAGTTPSTAPGAGAVAPPRTYVVSGHVTWPDGRPAVGVAVRAYDEDLRADQPLGAYAPSFQEDTRTDASGAYTIAYSQAQFATAEIESADLIVRVLDADGSVVASSPTVFNAPQKQTVDVTIAGRVTGQPSEYERLVAEITPLCRDATPPAITALEPADLAFLVGESGWSSEFIGDLLTAIELWRDAAAALANTPSAGHISDPDLLIPAFYGLVREGLPASWPALLQRGTTAISSALVAAASAGIVPLVLEHDAAAIGAELSALAARQALAPAGPAGSSGVTNVLAAANLSAAQQQTLLAAASTAAGSPDEFWSSLASQPGFDAPGAVAHVQLSVQLGLLTGNHAPLVKQLLADTAITSPKDLVAMDAVAWNTLLATQVDGKPIGIPPGVLGSTPAEQQANYVQGLIGTLQAAFPNETTAHLVATDATLVPDPDTRAGIGQFFTNSPDFDIRSTRISAYVTENGSTALAGIPRASQPAVIDGLKRVQRAFQISVSADSMSTLLGQGLDAAHKVADIPPKSFIDRFSIALGGGDVAQAVYNRATFINARSAELIAQLNDTVNGAWPIALTGGAFGNRRGGAQQQIVQAYPDYEELFGALDPCNCDDCTSVLSPTAYFVDMLQFLANSTPNSAGNTPLDVLIGKVANGNSLVGRRPDLAYLRLTCENTDTELPYIDLVNEVLESYIFYSGPSAQAAHDTGDTTTPELDASSQYTMDGRPGPYFTLATAVFPFTLPYNQPIAVARTYLTSLQTSREKVLSTFQTDPSAAAAAIDAEYLGLDPYLYQLLTGVDLQGSPVTNPAVSALYGYPSPSPGWESKVASVPTFLARSGIETIDLVALLLTAFINPALPIGPDLAFFNSIPFDYSTLMSIVTAGFTTTDPTVIAELADAGITMPELSAWWNEHPKIGQLLVLSCPGGTCDVEDGTIAHLAGGSPPTDPELDNLQAFIRLWRTVGWSIPDLDRAFTVLGATAITPSFIHDLAQIQRLAATLNPSVLQVLFALWGDLNPAGDDSLYTQLFLNPAALPTDSAFQPSPSGAVLQDASQTIGEHIPALVAALQVSADDLAAMGADAGLTSSSPLTLANVSTLYRYAVLASSLGMAVQDFITLKRLAGPALDPFTSPDAAVTFVALTQNVQQSGFTATQLAYLYEHQSAPPTGLAPQQTTLTVLAQALRGGLTQIAAQCAIAPDPKGTLTASAVTQLVSKTVATATVALVNGTAIFTAPLATLPGPLAKLDGSGALTGVDPTKSPAPVGAKLSYDPVAGTLGYAGAMTTQEYDALELVSTDPGYQTALSSLYGQPGTFLANNLDPLLDDPGAAGTLLRTTASLDGQLNPVMVDGSGNAVSDPTLAVSTAIAFKFGYLLGKLLPYLQNLLSHALAKQTFSDTFALDPTLTSLLLEQVLVSPTSPAHPLIGDLLALATGGVTAAYYPTADLSGAASAIATVPEVDFDGTSGAATLPAGTQSASFASWVQVPTSASFTFRVQTNGTPKLFVDDPETPVTLTPDPTTGVPTASVSLTAGSLLYLRLEVTALPSAGPATAVLSWQSPRNPATPIPDSAQLPDALFDAFSLAYVRFQKAALLSNLFVLTAPEIQYLATAGAGGLFAGFNLNALPLAAGTTTPAQATALFAVWPRLFAYTWLRNALPNGSVALIDVFSAPTFGAASALLPQATGWPIAVVGDLLTTFFPTATPSSANPLLDEIWPTTLLACVSLIHQVGASPAQLSSWATYAWASADATFDGLNAIAADIKKATASHYDPQSWLTVAEQLSDTLRGRQRDALVAYLLGLNGWTDPDKLFELLLIDPEMGTCMQTSRIRQALNSVQLFVQRCLLNLEAGGAPEVVVEPQQIDNDTWQEWMGAYSLWAANREVFLFPENWLLPPLRDDQTPQFEAFASSLQQGTITDDTVSTSLLTYLQGLEPIDRLDIRSVLWQPPDATIPDSVGILHVFARTFHNPRQYFYRQRIGGQTWTPWEQIQADIQGDHLIAAIWEGKLRLMWPVFTQQTYTPAPAPSSQLTSGSGMQQTPNAPDVPPQNYWQITLAWSDYYQGAWQPKNVSEDYLISSFGMLGTLPAVEQPAQTAYVFKARLDGQDLVVDMYEWPPHTKTWVVYLEGEFRFTACGDGLSVAYAPQTAANENALPYVFPPSKLGVTPSPHQSNTPIADAVLVLPPGTSVYNDGFRETHGGTKLTLLIGDIDDSPGTPTTPSSPSFAFLKATPSQFELRTTQQDWQFALDKPFFYQDGKRTFCVTPTLGWPVIVQLANPVKVDAPGFLTSGILAGIESAAPATDGGAGDRRVAALPPIAGAADVAELPVAATTVASLPESWLDYQQSSAHNWLAPGPFDPHLHLTPMSTLLSFQTHRHPYVCSLIEDLVSAQGQDASGGIDALLSISSQNPASNFNFATAYKPAPGYVEQPYPTETIDFSPTGAYADYNWELFFHAPLLVALTLSQNQQFQDADRWFRYIFDPTNSNPYVSSPDRYWQVQPFRQGVPQTLLALMQAIDAGDPDAVAQVTDWYHHPFHPFRIARLRLGAFMKYVFMAYVSNLIAWGDLLFGQEDTIESINQATQLYVFASELLGDLPEQLPSPRAPTELSYSQIRSQLDAFSNFAETIENEFPYASGVASNPQGSTSGLLGVSKLLFFCIPQNQQMLQLWSTVASRLYNIRHCLNIQGVPQQLALFQPPANPLVLIEAAAEGIAPGSVLTDVGAALPNYRFSYLIGKAAELAGVCQAFGKQLLDALEKSDAEGLALLRAAQETAIYTLMSDVKRDQIKEAQANVHALYASRNVSVTRYNYYQLLLGASGSTVPAVGQPIALATVPTQPAQSTGGVELISQESSELSLSNQAALLHAGSGLLQTLASIEATIPTIGIGVAAEPFGVGGTVSVSFGGSNLAASTEAVVHGLETLANYLTYLAWSAGKMGGYFRRQQEWTLQSNLAAGEIMQIDQQINAANLRVTAAQDDLAVTEAQITNSQKVQNYLTSKFTSQQLYGWMVSQTSSLYSQLYQLAYGTAKLAEVAYQRELGIRESSYITFGYWDSLRKGLLAGDRLQLAVRQLEQAYIQQNEREFEITRHVSLLLHDPGALIALKTTGECVVDLPEALFDMDYPGHYLRRLRDVSLTIPCVAGPYTSINCTLTLVSNKIRFDPTTGASSGGAGGYPEKHGQDPRFIYNFGSTAAIATSHAQDDSGVFSVNFRDERYLPFETAGVISRWMITMPQVCNAFDFDTITDVVLKLSYTSRYGGDLMRGQAFAAAILPALPQQTPGPVVGSLPKQTNRDRLFSVKHEFPSEWYGLLHPASSTAAYGQMPMRITTDRFPFQYRGQKISTANIEVFALLEAGATLTSLDVYLTPAGAPPSSPGTPPTPPTPNPASDEVALGTQSLYGTRTLYGLKSESSPVAVPQLWWLSVAAGDIDNVLDQVKDVFVLVHYTAG